MDEDFQVTSVHLVKKKTMMGVALVSLEWNFSKTIFDCGLSHKFGR